jgi:hypothetical protein
VPGKLNRRPWIFCGWGRATCGGGHGPATPSGGARGRRKPDAWITAFLREIDHRDGHAPWWSLLMDDGPYYYADNAVVVAAGQPVADTRV